MANREERAAAQAKIDEKFAQASALLEEAQEIGKKAGIYFTGDTGVEKLKESVIDGAQYFDSSSC